MYILVSFVTTHFGDLQARWHNMPSGTSLDGVPGLVDQTRQGALALFDTDTAVDAPIWQLPLESPAGFAIGTNRFVYVASMMGNRIFTLDENLRVIDSFSSIECNDLHSITLTHGGFIVSSSGTDKILGFSFDGIPSWSWWAGDHGYGDPAKLELPPKSDARLFEIGTSAQLTHLNSALPAHLDGEDIVLSTLFHQGQLVAIDRSTGHVRVLFRGINRPHAIRRREQGGWSVCASGDSAVVLLSETFQLQGVIEGAFDWVQDAVDVGGDTMLIADANHNRVISWSHSRRKASTAISYSKEWKIYQMDVLHDGEADWLKSPPNAIRTKEQQ